jgi:hypothetical protein
MAGTPEKMLEHLLETRLDNTKSEETTGNPHGMLAAVIVRSTNVWCVFYGYFYCIFRQLPGGLSVNTCDIYANREALSSTAFIVS